MTQHSEPAPVTEAPAGDQPPADASEDGMEASAETASRPARPDPTRYGDWEKAGRCIDF